MNTRPIEDCELLEKDVAPSPWSSIKQTSNVPAMTQP
jgi:hypothetical protein